MKSDIAYTPGQLIKITETFQQKGVTHEHTQLGLSLGAVSDFAELLTTLGNGNFDRDAFRKAAGLPPLVPDMIILEIDYSKSLEDMIAVGNYDWKNDSLTTTRFPIDGAGKGLVQYEARIFHFNRDISSESAIDLIKQEDSENPWEPAKTEHLLAFGAKYPDEQRKFPIIALGSVGEVGGYRYVPYLDRHGSERDLGLDWFGIGWSSDYRFLAVRKKVS